LRVRDATLLGGHNDTAEEASVPYFFLCLLNLKSLEDDLHPALPSRESVCPWTSKAPYVRARAVGGSRIQNSNNCRGLRSAPQRPKDAQPHPQGVIGTDAKRPVRGLGYSPTSRFPARFRKEAVPGIRTAVPLCIACQIVHGLCTGETFLTIDGYPNTLIRSGRTEDVARVSRQFYAEASNGRIYECTGHSTAMGLIRTPSSEDVRA
jgi:hypothetical protein